MSISTDTVYQQTNPFKWFKWLITLITYMFFSKHFSGFPQPHGTSWNRPWRLDLRRSCGIGMMFATCPKHGGWPPKTNILWACFMKLFSITSVFFRFHGQGCREMDNENSIVFGIGLGWYEATRSLNPLEFGISRHPSNEPVHWAFAFP